MSVAKSNKGYIISRTSKTQVNEQIQMLHHDLIIIIIIILLLLLSLLTQLVMVVLDTLTHLLDLIAEPPIADHPDTSFHLRCWI